MPEPEPTYTYRAGEKVQLEKAPDQFVVRALPETLETLGIDDAERVSSHSSRVTTRAHELEPQMSRMRNVAPTHHAYTDAAGAEFLITDRILVTFREPLPSDQIDSVSLVSPAGTLVPLHQRAGGDADNIIKTYTSATTPQLQTLRGQPVQGAWRLRIADLEAADVGKLNRWALKIVREP